MNLYTAFSRLNMYANKVQEDPEKNRNEGSSVQSAIREANAPSEPPCGSENILSDRSSVKDARSTKFHGFDPGNPRNPRLSWSRIRG